MSGEDLVGGAVMGACLIAYGLFGWPGLITVALSLIIGVWAWYGAKI